MERPTTAMLPVHCADCLAFLADHRPDLVDLVRLAFWLAYPAAVPHALAIMPPSGLDGARVFRLLEDLVDVVGMWRHPVDVQSSHYRNEADVPALHRLVELELQRPTVMGGRRLQLRQVRSHLEAVRDHRRDQARRRMA